MPHQLCPVVRRGVVHGVSLCWLLFQDAGRLLYCGQDDWCHINCALWSAEVYEDADGSLQNLVEAYSRGKMLVGARLNLHKLSMP